MHNPLLKLLTLKAQHHYKSFTVKELLNNFEADDKHLSEQDREKLFAIQEGIECYNRTPESLTIDIKSSTGAQNFFQPILENLDHEEVVVALLNSKNVVIAYKTIFVGTLSSCIMHPREIMNYVLKYPTARFMIAHNHPSGDTEPSGADINATERIKEIGDLMGIQLLDHIVVGHKHSQSLAEMGYI